MIRSGHPHAFPEEPTLKVSIFAQTLPTGQFTLSKPARETMECDVDNSQRLCQGTGLNGAMQPDPQRR